MCIVKAPNRGETLTKCYEIKFAHKASLMTRLAGTEQRATARTMTGYKARRHNRVERLVVPPVASENCLITRAFYYEQRWHCSVLKLLRF